MTIPFTRPDIRERLFGGEGRVKVESLRGTLAAPFTAGLNCELSAGGSVGKHVQATDDEIVIALEGGIRLTANSQVNRKNLHQLPQLFRHLMDRGAKAWQVQLTAAMGRAADEPRLFLEPYEVLYVHPTLAKLRLEADKRGVAFWAGNNIGYFGPFESVLRKQYRTGYRGSCGAGKITMGIEANGDIKGCPSLPTAEYVGGNIREHSLNDIWERSSQLRFTRDMGVTDLRGFCSGCYYADECRGGCHWTSHVLLGDRGDNPFCHHRALELMREGVRERVVLAEPAPGLPFDHARYEIVREPWPEDERRAVEALTREVDALVAGASAGGTE